MITKNTILNTDTVPKSASDKSKKYWHLRISLKVFAFESDGLVYDGDN